MSRISTLRIAALVLASSLFIFIYSIPDPLFSAPTATLLLSNEGELMGAKIAQDGQWRFSEPDSLPEKFEKCLLLFEDEYFYLHPGVNPFSVGRAIVNNIQKQKITSGGSTITMQLARLASGHSDRNLINKFIEMIKAFRIELTYSKNEILKMYATHAPFGGNVVGIEAASWRYFAKRPHQLSWAESALLAVLPNAPSLIFPGKNHHLLQIKRDNLLIKLYEKKVISQLDLSLAIAEDLPEKPHALPRLAPHFLQTQIKKGHNGETIKSTLKAPLQALVNDLLSNRKAYWNANNINNAAVLVLDTKTSDILAYAGNISGEKSGYGSEIDMVEAPRSTGSILKPLLYALALQKGMISPRMLLPDIPVTYNGYSPKNYALSYDGAVEARMVVARSLNVPSVRLLSDVGVAQFLDFLKQIGFTQFNRSSAHYGLSLILGGAETSLAEVCKVYANLARQLIGFPLYSNGYLLSNNHIINGMADSTIHMPDSETAKSSLQKTNVISAGVIYAMLDAMIEVNRPDEEASWQEFLSSRKVAWKTGTSFGNRDGWAVGICPKYIVGVWVGNASGASSPLLTGIGSAAPVMFELLSKLGNWQWFDRPFDDEYKEVVCKQSGHKAGQYCTEKVSERWPLTCIKSTVCPYHRVVYVSKDGSRRLNQSCALPNELEQRNWFVLPPAMEHYYKQKHLSYASLPPFDKRCEGEQTNPIEIIYPSDNAEIFLPKGFAGEKSKLVLQAVHQLTDATLFWHIDEQYVAQSRDFHQVAVELKPGKHKLSIVDQNGETREVNFQIINPK